MAYYSIFPEKDTTIYSHPDRIHMNAGKDEALELVEEKLATGNVYYSSRILIKFKNEEIKDVIENTIGSSTFNNNTSKVNLKLYETETKNLIKFLEKQSVTPNEINSILKKKESSILKQKVKIKTLLCGAEMGGLAEPTTGVTVIL